MSQLVSKSRSEFRKAKGISEDSYVFFVDGGSNASEIKFSFKSFKDGFNQFFKNSSVSTVNKTHFEILVSAQEGVKKYLFRPLAMFRVNSASFLVM